MNRAAKSLVVASSLVLAGALIAYEGGYIPLNFAAYGQTPQTAATAPVPATILPSSKSKAIEPAAPVWTAAPAATAAASQPPVMMFSSKTVVITPSPANSEATATSTSTAPSTTVQPTMILPSSKLIIVAPAPSAADADSAPASGPYLLMSGSKSEVPVVPPPAASQGAQKKGGQ